MWYSKRQRSRHNKSFSKLEASVSTVLESKKKPLKKKNKSTNSDSSSKKSSYKIAFLALLVLLLIILTSKLFQFIISLDKPISPDLLNKKTYQWESETAINLAIKSDAIYLLSLEPNESKITILKVPDDAYMTLPKGYGSWRVGSIYDLGQQESPPVGSELLSLSLYKLLGLPIDGFITLNNTQPPEEMINNLQSNPLYALSFINNISTDLTPKEIYRFITKVREVREDKITQLDLTQSEITQSKLLPDSSRVLGVDNIQLDLFIRKNLADPLFFDEDTSIAVFNSTSYPGLAQEVSRIVTNMGGRVINTANIDNPQPQTLVISKDDNLSRKRLSQVFAPQCIKKGCTIDDSKVQDSRAQINIVIGEDFYDNLHKR